MTKEKANFIYNVLQELFPNAGCELNFKTDFELLIAVILSAQATDKRINLITPILFNKYKDVYELSKAKQDDVEKIIYSANYYKNKSKNIIECSKKIVEQFNGKVPNTREGLESLPGVGRKTANVILSTAFNVPAIAVDTHVFRVANRLGFVNTTKEIEVEKALMKIYDKDKWTSVHHMFVLFGRYYCTAKKPQCDKCKFKDICKYYKENKK